MSVCGYDYKDITHATSYSADALIDLPSVVVIGGQSGLFSPVFLTTAMFNLISQRAKAHSLRPSVGYVNRQFVLYLVFHF
jgi:hypothetical protein